MSGETSGPHEKLEGKQQEAHDEVLVQDSNLGHVAHTSREKSHDSENPSRSTQPPTHEKERASLGASVKGSPVKKRKARAHARESRQSDEKLERTKQEKGQVSEQVVQERARAKQERQRLENKRRLEGQILENERKCEALRKAQEVEVAARSQVEREEPSTNEGKNPSQRRSGKKGKGALRVPRMAFKVDDDQKVDHDEDAEIICAPELKVLEHETGVTCLTITEEEHSESHLIMMALPTPAVFFAPPSPPITPRYSSDSASPHSGFAYCSDDATHQCECWYGGLVREDSQTSMESNYLFEPPLRWPSPQPVESAETRQDATDVLFQPSLVLSGDNAGSPVITVNVIIPKAKTERAENRALNDGVSIGDSTGEFQRGRHATGRGGYRGFRKRGTRSKRP